MITIANSGNQTINRTGLDKQVAVRNLDASNTINVKINEDTTGFTVEASGRAGWRLNTGIYVVTITAANNWEVTFGT